MRPSKSEETARRLHAAAIRLLRGLRAEDALSGMSGPRLSVLSILVFGGPRRAKDLAEAEQVTAATMSKLLAGLERDGYVRREADPDDGRAMRVTATAAGRNVLEAGRDRRVARLAASLAALSKSDREAIERALDALERVGHS